MNLSVDVISDVICPWCYIGKRRLQKAIAAHGKPVTVQSNPQTLIDVVAKAGLNRKRAEAMLDGDEGMEAIKAGFTIGQYVMLVDCISRSLRCIARKLGVKQLANAA